MEVGACFDNFAAVKRAAADHASLNGYSFSVDKNDKNRLVLACRTTDCPYHLRAIIDCRSVCKITKLNLTHTCADNLQEGRGSQNAKKLVAQAIHTGMVVNPETTTKQIIKITCECSMGRFLLTLRLCVSKKIYCQNLQMTNGNNSGSSDPTVQL
ncbi:hypothetical protein PsorP6_005680 [Peronosclerospora sorghi]|uniref:Uncharacterized protein n=1 Tax=Peronosclerospora sorghi TaxID=230839 RepID=A0ACC0W2H8_9STRA|nr:hypothetical protein PsorP6_005680 [Peronosclerospora sorghi]